MLQTHWKRFSRSEFALGYMRTFSAYRCDLASVGLSTKQGDVRYHFRNAQRSVGCIFQYTLAGEGLFCDHGRNLVVPAGTGFLVETPSNTSYRLPDRRPDADPHWEFIYLTFTGDAAHYHVNRLLSHHGPLVALPLESHPVSIMFHLYKQMLDHQEPDELDINAQVNRFLLELARAMRTPTHELPKSVVAACDHVDRHLSQASLTVDDLAQVACYSRFHFTRLFKSHMGVTPYQYLLQQRIRRAMDLLTTTSRPIKQIAMDVGFSNVSWFYNAFRKQMHATPADIRARMNPQGNQVE